jgi:hypothetical protein
LKGIVIIYILSCKKQCLNFTHAALHATGHEDSRNTRHQVEMVHVFFATQTLAGPHIVQWGTPIIAVKSREYGKKWGQLFKE